MPFTWKALKGLATLLNIIGNKRGGAVMEVQCLQMAGRNVIFAGNSSVEAGRLADGLSVVGAGASEAIVNSAALKKCFLAVYGEVKLWSWNKETGKAEKATTGGVQTRLQPVAKTLAQNLWLGENYLKGIEVLGTETGWSTTFTDLVGIIPAGTSPLKSEQKTTIANNANYKLWKGGHELLTPPKGKAPAVTRAWTINGVTDTTAYSLPMENVAAGLSLIDSQQGKSSAGGEVKIDLHAEQTLLFALAMHIRNGGTTGNVTLGGKKVACHVCRPVLDAFKTAYEHASGGSTFTFDTNSKQKSESGNISGVLTLPAPKEGANPKYVSFYDKFVATYKAG